MNIDELITKYREEGYPLADARSSACHDIILSKIFKSKFKEHITIKGGVVMHNISNSMRRATQDLDMDFIKYSLKDDSIKQFISKLDKVDDGIKVEILGNIEELKHQDYSGKRVFIKISDNYGNSLENKIDLGVQKEFDIEQDEYYFNLNSIDGSICLLINSKEQIFTEKLKSLLKLGFRSGRHKDLFDFYYLINDAKLDKHKLLKCIDVLIFQDDKMRENSISDIYSRLDGVFSSRVYRSNLNNPKNNWLDIRIDDAIESVLNYVNELSEEFVAI
ncbi:MAG: nucleotidyl transferase AbiEii/AbiGii toxin family protein [Bacilli bacterium]|nr:nucleotidyl transferase AbiEii/AbiGii toxin family protein [Bacilli bacterium]